MGVAVWSVWSIECGWLCGACGEQCGGGNAESMRAPGQCGGSIRTNHFNVSPKAEP